MDSETLIVCRCENITLAEVEAAVADGARTFGDVKRRVRTGMGICQGRTCEALIARLVAQYTDCSVEEAGTRSVRMPVRPLSYGALGTGSLEEVEAEFGGKTLMPHALASEEGARDG